MARLGVGRAVNFVKRHHMGIAAGGAIALAAGQVRPMQPISEAAQAEIFGDPNGAQTIFAGSVKSAISDTFLGYSAEERINELQRPIHRSRYEPNGALVLGMYAARQG